MAAEIQSAGGVARAIPADVSDEAQSASLVAQAVAAFGGVNILVNNAGLFQLVPFAETSVELFDRILAVNLRGAFLCCRAAWPHLQKNSGQIANVSSVAGVGGYVGSAAYCASKFGLNGLSEVLALEGEPHGVRVFAVCPGSVDTPIWEGQAPADVMRRMMKAEPIAELVRWLLTSPRNLHFGPVIVRNFHTPWNDET